MSMSTVPLLSSMTAVPNGFPALLNFSVKLVSSPAVTAGWCERQFGRSPTGQVMYGSTDGSYWSNGWPDM